jgi:hypothetical protein
MVSARGGRRPRIGTAPGEPFRGVIAEHVAPGTPLDPYLPLKELSKVCGYGVRWLRYRIHDPVDPLPYHRPGGKIIVRRSEFDAWMARRQRIGTPDIDRVVATVVSAVRGTRAA